MVSANERSAGALKICMITAELTPLAKTGGLGDVASALSVWLNHHRHDVRVFLPFYSDIGLGPNDAVPVEFVRDVEIDMGGRRLAFTLCTALLPGSSLPVHLVHCPELYHRPGIYSDQIDEPVRFAFLTRAALESCQRMAWAPDVVHAHDWHTALAPLYLRQVYGWDQLFSSTRTLLTIHNIAYQGVFGARTLPALGLANERSFFDGSDLAEDRINFLKTGIRYSGLLSTVSPTHADEIQTAAYGRGLDALLRARRDHLVGILNGVDYSQWSPEHDPLLPHRYGPSDLSGKERMKQTLLAELSLPYQPEAPVVGIVSRLVAQKGFELLFEPMPEMLERRNLRLVVLGSGDSRYESFFSELQRRFPQRVCFYRGFSEKLAHWIEAGSDIFLMPSAYEPCGLNQMYSLKYGTVPVVRRTGGLADSVEPYDAERGAGTGFLFDSFDPWSFKAALEAALDLFPDRSAWRRLMLAGMARDFSWQRQGERYLALYRALT